MPICFYVEGGHGREEGPLLPEPLFVYLLDLAPQIRSSVAWLNDLDYHGDSRFPAQSGEAAALAAAVRELERELASADWSRFPPMPEAGDEQLAESPPLTRDWVMTFLASLASAAERTDELAGTLVGYGD